MKSYLDYLKIRIAIFYFSCKMVLLSNTPLSHNWWK